jgi:hypothetical protein
MEPGQRFVVDQVNKPHGETVNMVRVLAHRYGKRVSVTHHPTRIGYTLIECKEWDDIAKPAKHVLKLDWHQFEQLMIEHAGTVANDAMIGQASYSWPVRWIAKPRMDQVQLKLFDGFYTVSFEEDRVVSKRHGGEAESIPLPSADRGDMFGAMFAGEKPVEEAERKLLED